MSIAQTEEAPEDDELEEGEEGTTNCQGAKSCDVDKPNKAGFEQTEETKPGAARGAGRKGLGTALKSGGGTCGELLPTTESNRSRLDNHTVISSGRSSREVRKNGGNWASTARSGTGWTIDSNLASEITAETQVIVHPGLRFLVRGLSTSGRSLGEEIHGNVTSSGQRGRDKCQDLLR